MGARKRDTCGVTSFGGDTSATGRYAWDARRPRLTVQPGDSPAEEFPTRLAGDTVEVYDTYTHTRYRYRRARGSARPSGPPARSQAPPNEALHLASMRDQGSAAVGSVADGPHRAPEARK
jgi:hypothetical protein